MASVDVTTWAEFLEAASGNDPTLEINCPENGLWDLAEIEPEGHSGSIPITGIINGNGTQIKNLVIQRGQGAYESTFRINGEVYDLHFLNCQLTPQDGLVAFMSNTCRFERCTISASCVGNGRVFTGNGGTVYRCALNLEYSGSITVTVIGPNISCEYLNAKISGSNVERVIINNQNSSYVLNSYLIFDTPAVVELTGSRVWWSVIRCTGANVTNLSTFNSNWFCLGVDYDFQNVQTVGSGMMLVSETQLRDADYLQSIGFPIGA